MLEMCIRHNLSYFTIRLEISLPSTFRVEIRRARAIRATHLRQSVNGSNLLHRAWRFVDKFIIISTNNYLLRPNIFQLLFFSS